mmetsp:Transcript_28193/g.38775  ORF Transcript_28193/g.38775 Transcript_28193/m.38775 type:complete len:215 (-) Transcript_28193:1027-1671(-)
MQGLLQLVGQQVGQEAHLLADGAGQGRVDAGRCGPEKRLGLALLAPHAATAAAAVAVQRCLLAAASDWVGVGCLVAAVRPGQTESEPVRVEDHVEAVHEVGPQHRARRLRQIHPVGVAPAPDDLYIVGRRALHVHEAPVRLQAVHQHGQAGQLGRRQGHLVVVVLLPACQLSKQRLELLLRGSRQVGVGGAAVHDGPFARVEHRGGQAQRCGHR